MLAANADPIWARLTQAMGRPELASDERYATHVARGSRPEEVDGLVAAWTATMDLDRLAAALAAASVPHGLIYRATDILEDPQYRAREMVQRVFDPALGRDVPMPGVVPRLSRTPGRIRWAGAAIGAHTDEVLAELGAPEDLDARRDG